MLLSFFVMKRKGKGGEEMVWKEGGGEGIAWKGKGAHSSLLHLKMRGK
jgi:hypothetical protein